MPFYKQLLFITLLAASTLMAHSAALSLNVESAAAYAVSHNPSLAAARLRIEEARGRLDAAGRRPNPELEWQFSQNIRTTDHGVEVAWMQKFPRTARLALEKSISRAEVTAAEAEVSDASRILAGEARAAVVALLALENERSLRERQIANSEELAAFMKKRVQSGEASAVDASQIELETRQLGTQVLMLNVEKAKLLGTLRALLGVASTKAVTITGELSNPAELPGKEIQPAARGDYRAAQAKAEAARQSVYLAKANKWEDITLGISATHDRAEDAPDGLQRDTTIGIRVNIPLPLWNKNEGQMREATAAARRTELEIDAVVIRARAEVAAARNEMAALAKIIAEIDSSLIPQSKNIEEQLRANYAGGLTPFTEVVRARGKRFEMEAQRLDVLRNWHLARARHRTANGNKPSGKN